MIEEPSALLGHHRAEIVRFGNHNRKHLFQLQKYGEDMARLAHDAGLSLDSFPEDPGAETEQLRAAAGDRTPQVLGAYYALHYLKLNASTLALLRSEGSRARDRYALYRRVIGGYERSYGALVRALLTSYVAHFGQSMDVPAYTVLNVGSFTDHEDIDVALVADARDGGGGLDRLVGALSQEFFRRAAPLHFYLSEHFAENRFWGSFAEYGRILDEHLRNFVVVGQLLTATRLAGSRRLYKSIMQEIHRRYFAESGDTRHREGFLRGTLGELDVLLSQRDRSDDFLNPKREVYRLIKLLVAAVRTIFLIKRPSILANLKTLGQQYDPAHAQEYRNLRRAFAFNEVFRYLYNLLVVPADEIRLDSENVPESLSEIGFLMGFGRDDRGPLQALLLNYAEHLARSLQAGLALSHLLRDNLKEISIFRRLLADGLSPAGPGRKPRGVALELLEDVKRTKAQIFWDDIQEVIQESPETLTRFVDDLGRLPEEDREQAVRSYVLLMTAHLKSLIELLIFLPSLPSRPRRHEVGRLFLEATIECLRAFPYKLRDYGAVVSADPELLARLIAAYEPDVADRLSRLLQDQAESGRVDRQILWHRTLAVTEHGQSKYLSRLLKRVLQRRPEVKRLVGEPMRLRELADELRRESGRTAVFGERRELLGDAFDLEMLRLALGTLLLGESPERYREYQVVVDEYVAEVLKSCLHEVSESRPVFSRISYPAGVSLYATGGNARGEGLGDDYDFVALIDDRAAAERDFFNRTLGKLVTTISRRTMLAHNRFADHLNVYALTVGDLATLLDHPPAEGFIDQSELVDARPVIEDPWIEGRFRREILLRRVYDRADEFVASMVEELGAQEAFEASRSSEGIDVKQGPGGLRMINMVLLMAKARLRVRAPLTAAALPQLRAARPALGEDLEVLEASRRFVKRVRDTYRLGVAYSDVVLPELLGDLVPFVYGATSRRTSQDLESDLRAALATARECVWRLVDGLETPA